MVTVVVTWFGFGFGFGLGLGLGLGFGLVGDVAVTEALPMECRLVLPGSG